MGQPVKQKLIYLSHSKLDENGKQVFLGTTWDKQPPVWDQLVELKLSELSKEEIEKLPDFSRWSPKAK